jgi:hypothetical protein
MKDAPPGGKKVSQHDQLIREFVNEVSRDLKRLLARGNELRDLDPISWRRVQTTAHHIAGRAGQLQLQVLAHCARELEEFAARILSATHADRSESVHAAMIAFEMIHLELKALEGSTQSS